MRNAHYGKGEGRILLDDLLCGGNEPNLLECTTILDSPLFSGNCDHSEDAGVKCNGSESHPVNALTNFSLYY